MGLESTGPNISLEGLAGSSGDTAHMHGLQTDSFDLSVPLKVYVPDEEHFQTHYVRFQ